jgi:predicted ribosomally synthesized peptide with nif11-like leader
MSTVIEGFFQHLASDASLQAACSDAVGRGDLAEVVRLAGGAGFTFTVAELTEAWNAQTAAMSDGELANVAGGVGCMQSATYLCTSCHTAVSGNLTNPRTLVCVSAGAPTKKIGS